MSIISLAGSRADREEVRASPLPRPPLGFEAIASDGLNVQAAVAPPVRFTLQFAIGCPEWLTILPPMLYSVGAAGWA